MDNKIGEHYIDAETQRVTPIELHGQWYEVSENKFNNQWSVAQSLPDTSSVNTIDELKETYTRILGEIQVLQLLNYEFQECDSGVAFWAKDLSE